MQFNISKETHQKLKDKIKELENEIQKKKLTGTTDELYSTLNIAGVRHLVCMNLQKTCSALDRGKCKMVKGKCVFQQTCA